MPTAILTPRTMYPTSPKRYDFGFTNLGASEPWEMLVTHRPMVLDAASIFYDTKASGLGRLQLMAGPINSFLGGTGRLALLSPTVRLAGAAAITITGSTTGAAPVFTTSAAHGLAVGEIIRIAGSNSTPGVDGTWVIATVPNTDEFTITSPPTLTVACTAGDIFTSGFDLQKPARHVYYSDELTQMAYTVTGNTAANPSVFTTSTAHGLVIGQTVKITNSNSTPSANGTWIVATVPLTTTFTLAGLGAVSVAGTMGNIEVAGPTLQGSRPTGQNLDSGIGLVIPAGLPIGWTLVGGAGAKTGVTNFLTSLWLRDYLG